MAQQNGSRGNPTSGFGNLDSSIPTSIKQKDVNMAPVIYKRSAESLIPDWRSEDFEPMTVNGEIEPLKMRIA